MLAIRIAEREIFGRPPDMSRPYGLFVKRGGFQGWQGLSNTRREALARAVQHGEHDAPVYLGARVVTIDGWALAPSEKKLGHETDHVTGLLAVGRALAEISHLGSDRCAEARVTVAESTDLGYSHGLLRAEFQLQLTFADPRRYGEGRVFPRTGPSTSVAVSHKGNFPAYPRFVIPDAPAAYSITSPLGTFTVSSATAGGTHEVDLRSGRVYRNGVEMDDVGSGDLWTIPPGMPVAHTLSVPGTALIDDTFA